MATETENVNVDNGVPPPPVWHAVAGKVLSHLIVGSKVFYFPEGHYNQDFKDELPSALLPPYQPNAKPECYVCEVLGINYFSGFRRRDNVFAELKMRPITAVGSLTDPVCIDSPILLPLIQQEEQPLEWREKILTNSDVNSRQLLLPESLRDFFQSNLFEELGQQFLNVVDLYGKPYKFNYTTPHLKTQWNVFCKAKMPLAGDTVVFVRDTNNTLYVGLRRHVSPQLLEVRQFWMEATGRLDSLKAANHAFNRWEFKALYFPSQEISDFCISEKKVLYALRAYARMIPGRKVNASLPDLCPGVISSVIDVLTESVLHTSPWKSLEITFDDKKRTRDDTKQARKMNLSPWDVNLVDEATSSSSSSPLVERDFIGIGQ